MGAVFEVRMAEKQTKPDMSKARDEKIRRYRVDKECEKRLAEIKMMEVAAHRHLHA